MRKRLALFGLSVALAIWGRPAVCEELDFSDCPLAIQQILKLEAAGNAIETVDKNIDEGRVFFGASVTIDGALYWIVVREDGVLLEKNLDLVDGAAEAPFAEAPAAVQKTFREESKDAKLETVLRGTENGKLVFSVQAAIQGKNYEIKASEDGTLLEKRLALEGDAEIGIPFADAPAAVRKTLASEARGAKIDTLIKQIQWGDTQYLANTTIDGKGYAITAAENGALLTKAYAGDDAGK